MATSVGLWKLALDLVLEEEASLGVSWSLSVPITFPVVWKQQRVLTKNKLSYRRKIILEWDSVGDNRVNDYPKLSVCMEE